MLKRLVLVTFIVTISAASSGCFLRLMLGATETQSLRDEINLIIDSIWADATTAVCGARFGGGSECTFVVGGQDIGSTAYFLSEFGIFGVVIDPLVLELPANATDISGTYVGGGAAGKLVVHAGLSYVPIDDTRTLTAASGKQLVILDLPEGAAVDGVDYRFNFSFRRLAPPGTGPTRFKAVATAKLDVAGKRFYPPIFPCVDSFAEVPEIQMPGSSTPQAFTLPSGLAGCSDKRYQFFRFPRACDLDNDSDVDSNDVNQIMNARNRPAAPGDPRDANVDGLINANDARVCTARCTRARCAQ